MAKKHFITINFQLSTRNQRLLRSYYVFVIYCWMLNLCLALFFPIALFACDRIFSFSVVFSNVVLSLSGFPSCSLVLP